LRAAANRVTAFGPVGTIVTAFLGMWKAFRWIW
jgi:hypothetical protein